MIIKCDEKLKEVFDSVEKHLVNACEVITKDGVLFKDNEKMYYTQCTCITIYNMLVDMLDEVTEFAIDNRDNPIDMKLLGALLCKLIVVENTTEECCQELIAFGIDGEEVLEELCRASTPLEKFVWRLIPPVEQ